MSRILVSVSNDINNDQRLFRTCLTLAEQGHDVFVIGRNKPNSKPVQVPFEHKRIRMLFSRGFLFYAFFNLRLFFVLLASKKDLLVANDLDTLLPNYLVSRLQNKSLVFDSHELFSEVPELENRGFAKKVWRSLEDHLIPKLKHVITVSQGIASYYQRHYQIEAVVVRNVPIAKKTKPQEIEGVYRKQKVIWYQGAVNVGRGLELVIDTVPFLDDYIFLIAGEGDIIETLENKVLRLELENKVKFLGKLDPNELKKLAPNATVGISLEEDLGLNYRYAMPNKVFDYIHAEIPVIVSDLPEMAGLVREYQVGEVLTERTPKALSELILTLSQNDYQKELAKAKKQLTWSLEKNKLTSLIDTAI